MLCVKHLLSLGLKQIDMLVQFLVSDFDDDDTIIEWRDLYIDESKIIGFYLPDSDDVMESSINILLAEITFTLKQEKHLLDYLDKRFVNTI
jgi:hypothetical protein